MGLVLALLSYGGNNGAFGVPFECKHPLLRVRCLHHQRRHRAWAQAVALTDGFAHGVTNGRILP